jgi:hypothetical protein
MVAALGLALVACQGMDEPHEPSVVGAEESLIRFKHPDFASDQGFYTVERYPRSGNQLHMARFLGVDAVAMLLIYKTSASYVVQERATEAYVAQLMDGKELDWGETGSAASRLGAVRYRLFDVVGQPFSCVGFGQTVGDTSDDRGRRSDVVAGYFCQENSRPMSAESAEDLIGRVSFAGRS